MGEVITIQVGGGGSSIGTLSYFFYWDDCEINTWKRDNVNSVFYLFWKMPADLLFLVHARHS